MKLRPMTMADADKMLEWKNDTITRKFSIVSHEEINKHDHYQWLQKNIQHFQVIETLYGRSGAIRIQEHEISIWIDFQFRRNNLATSVLKQVSQKGMFAKIVEGNIGSMRCFINAGFKPISYQDNYYIFQK